MRTYLHSFAGVVWFMTISSATAVPVYGTFSGEVVGSHGWLAPYAAGTPVTGRYEYDTAYFGGGETGSLDPICYFLVNIDGQGFAGWSAIHNGLGFSVDANGEPVNGSAAGSWDLYIGNGGLLGMNTLGDNGVEAAVTYATPSVPDAAATFCLTAVALLGLAVYVRVFAQPPEMPAIVSSGATPATSPFPQTKN